MASMWDIGKSSEENKNEGTAWMDKEEISERFVERFEENMGREVPRHPYHVYRDILEERDLYDSEKIVLEQLKEEYAEKWRDITNKDGTGDT